MRRKPLMSSEVRKEVILERLDRDQRVSVLELSGEFGVSGETIRRDLKDLEAVDAPPIRRSPSVSSCMRWRRMKLPV
jgi:predicted DNA-binding transcriptional regulator YafY